MRNSHWNDLVSMTEGKMLNYQPSGFIIDSPWIANWYGMLNIDYYSSDEYWLKANFEAINTFPDVWFMPTFWAEYGMCTEPSAFGSRMKFLQNNLPHAERVLHDISEVDNLPYPDVKTDGLLPFSINRLKINHNKIIEADHQVRFAIARGPLNIASFLMGTTEFMMALAMNPDNSHKLLKKISDFLCDWLSWQKECFPSIDGVLILDDLIGFLGDADFREFVVPNMKRIMDTIGPKVRFLHNDAEGLITAANLKDMGVNMFNFSFNHSMGRIRELAGPGIILVGNIPPRDVLAAGTPAEVDEAVKKAFGEIEDKRMIIWSAGGGMPYGTNNANIKAFASAVNEYSK